MKHVPEEILEKGRKIKRYLKNDSEGERNAAKRKYEEFLKKHNLQDSDVDPEANTRKIYAKHDDEVDLLLNIILSVNPFTKHSTDKKEITCELDNEDYIEVLEKYEYFGKLFRVEKELLIVAFSSKHKKFMTPDDDAKIKWRSHKKENEAIKNFKDEMVEVKEEWLNQQADVKKGRISESTLAENVMNSNDRVKIMAFNANRSVMLQSILLDARYIKNKRTISSKKHE